MKKKLLLLTVSAIFVTSTAFAAGTVTDNDTQTITLAVPEVALLDITDATESLSLTEPTTAGDNFAPATAVTDYAISANTATGTSQTRHIDVAITSGTIPRGGKLTITPLTTGMTGASISAANLTSTTTSKTGLISGIGNIATTVPNGIGYSFGPAVSTEMVSYTPASPSTDIELTYTLSVDS